MCSLQNSNPKDKANNKVSKLYKKINKKEGVRKEWAITSSLFSYFPRKEDKPSSEFQNLIQFSFLLSCLLAIKTSSSLKTGIYFFPLIYFPVKSIFYIASYGLDDSKISHHVLSFVLRKSAMGWAFVVVVLRFGGCVEENALKQGETRV